MYMSLIYFLTSNRIAPTYLYMNYSAWILLILSFTWTACESPPQQQIDITSIHSSGNRTMVQEEEVVTFLNDKHEEISPERFSQLLAEGSYLSNHTFLPDGSEEVQLITVEEHAKRLETQRLPNFQFTDLNGNTYTRDLLKGKVVVLSFWFTASLLCTEEIAALDNLVQKYNANDNLVWIAPALDKTVDLSRYLKRAEWNYNFVADQEHLAIQLGILTYPTHLIINEKGKIIKAVVRHPDATKTIDNTLQDLL